MRHLDLLEHAENPINKDGRQNKGKAIGMFLGFMKDFDLEIHKITTEDIKAFLETRPNNDSFNRYRTSLSQTFEYAIDELNITDYNPVSKIKRKIATHEERICPTALEVLLLIRVAGNDFPPPTSKSKYKKIRCDERDLILIILYAMARPGEIIKLKWKDISWGSRILTKKTKKTKTRKIKKIPVPMNNNLYAILKRRWRERQQDEWVFWNHRTKGPYGRRAKLMKKLCKKAEVRKLDLHGFRHFITTKLSNDPKIALPAVQKLLGHGSIQTTQGYMHPIDATQQTAAISLEGEFDTIEGEFVVLPSDPNLP